MRGWSRLFAAACLTLGVAALAGVVILIAPRLYKDDGEGDDAKPPLIVAIESTATRIPDRRSLLPLDLELPANLTFCEPLLNANGEIAVVREGEVIYSNGTCDPKVDDQGRVTSRAAEGALEMIVPDYTAAGAAVRQDIVWVPATGLLDGTPAVFTGSYIGSAEITYDSFDNPLVLLEVEPGDGQTIIQSLTERIVGYPLATFIGNHPLLGGDGSVIAPVVASPITDALVTSGLTDADVERIVELFDDGQLR